MKPQNFTTENTEKKLVFKNSVHSVVYPPPPEADKFGGLPAYGMAPEATRVNYFFQVKSKRVYQAVNTPQAY